MKGRDVDQKLKQSVGQYYFWNGHSVALGGMYALPVIVARQDLLLAAVIFVVCGVVLAAENSPARKKVALVWVIGLLISIGLITLLANLYLQLIFGFASYVFLLLLLGQKSKHQWTTKGDGG